MTLEELDGTYVEHGEWRDRAGQRGTLSGRITLRTANDGLEVRSDDGHVMTCEPFRRGEAVLTGDGGGATSRGFAYLGAESFILEYVADVGGRQERNTDIWWFGPNGISRAGLIRQAERLIWFEADMSRE